MKWIFIVLFALNFILISMQWIHARNSQVEIEYEEKKGSKRLRLLNEVRSDQNKLLDSPVCTLLGPIKSKVFAEDMRSEMLIKDLKSSVIVQEVKKAPSYWVYFDNFEQKSNQEVLLSFENKNIDSYIVSAGELKGVVSLGAFENIDLAHRLKKIMKKRGYETKISEIGRREQEFWLQLFASYTAENKKKIDEILKPLTKKPDIREILCKSVASGK